MGQWAVLANAFSNTTTAISLKPYQNMLKWVKFHRPRHVLSQRLCPYSVPAEGKSSYNWMQQCSAPLSAMRIAEMSCVPPGCPSCIPSASPRVCLTRSAQTGHFHLSASLLHFSGFAFPLPFSKEWPELPVVFPVQGKAWIYRWHKDVFYFVLLIIFMSLFAFSVWLSTQMIFAVNSTQWP